MELGNKIFKAISYIFLIFIIVIIIVQFGMPSFIGTANQANRFKAAEINGEIISRKDVDRMRRQIMATQFGGQEVPEMFREQLTASALENLIDRKLFLVFAKKSGFYPKGKEAGKSINSYLKLNFPSFVSVNNQFDYTRFHEEFLKPQGITIKELTEEASISYLHSLIRDLSFANDSIAKDMAMLDKISYSISVLVFDYNFLRKQLGKQVSEEEIQKQFVEKYLKENPKEKLNEVIRQAIVKGIVDKKLPEYEKTFKENIKEDASSLSLQEISKKYKNKIVSLKNISVAKGLQGSVAENTPANVFYLEDDPNFLSSVFSASEGKLLGPWEIEGATYFVSLDKKTIPDFENLTLSEEELETFELQEKENSFSASFMVFFKNLRNVIPVKKYSLPKE